MRRRVVVTGVGLICALGIGTEQVWEKLLAGTAGVGPITQFDASAFDCRIAAEIRDFDPLNWIPKKELKKMGRFIQLAMAAADFALRMAALEITPSIADSAGVYIASGIGGFDVIEREHMKLLQGGPGRISPFFIPAAIINLASGMISIRYGARGPNSATATACSASAHAVGDSFRLIERGDAEVMICGGTEAAITPMGIGGFAAMKALSTRNEQPACASRPFDAERDGFVVGEGAGILVIESLDHAQKRNASILAEMVGYGMSGDANHITQPAEDGDGAYRVMQASLRDAGVEAEAGRLRQRAWHLDSARRCHRNAGAQARFRRARKKDRRKLDQVHDRPSARRRGWFGSGNQRAGAARPKAAADHQLRASRSRVRPGLRAQPRARGGCGIRPIQLLRLRRHQRRARFQALALIGNRA